VPWELIYTDQYEDWYESLTDPLEVRAVNEGMKMLREKGPALGRPLVDRVETSRHHNMKELRPLGMSLRILFIFDPDRRGVLLLGGDKAGQWKRWYAENVPIADKLYESYLDRRRQP
jgi:hypothetical protein